ncbi:MAG: ATP-binding protein [Halanaeroarchaeum sp.]
MARAPADVEPYKSRLEAAMLAGNVAWWEMDVPSGGVDFHESKATVLGYDPERFTHYEDFTELLHPEDHDRAMDSMRRHLEGDASRYDVEYRIEAADGTYHWFHDVGGITERTDDGGPLRVSGIVIDITQRKEYAAAVARRNEQLTLLNRLVRHDIRNDLSLVLGLLETLDDGERSVDDVIDRIRSAAQHAVDTTDSVQTVLSVLDEEADPSSMAISLPSVLAREVEAVRTEHPGATIAAEDVPDVEVRGNEVLSSVFRNLLENAVEHSDREEPSVSVTVSVDGESVTVSVADDGPGIPDEMKAQVFQRGESSDESGLGLGLYLVDTLVRAFGGDVGVRDNEPRGTVFEVTLPRA